MAYDIEDRIWDIEEDAPKVEVRNGNVINGRHEWRNAHSQCTGQGSRWCRRQGRPWFLRDISCGSASCLGGGNFDQGSNQSSQQSTMMRVSGESK